MYIPVLVIFKVEVFINGIPSWCSGDCGFTWSESKTPKVTGISPTQGGENDQVSHKSCHLNSQWYLVVYITDIICRSGSSSLGTVLTITGSGFDGGNVTVKTGDVECSLLQVTSKPKPSNVIKSVFLKGQTAFRWHIAFAKRMQHNIICHF